MSRLDVVLAIVAAAIIVSVCGFMVGRHFPPSRLLDRLWDSGYELGAQDTRLRFYAESRIVSGFNLNAALGPIDENPGHPTVWESIEEAPEPGLIEPTRVISPEPDTGTLYNLNDPAFWYPENQERIHQKGYHFSSVTIEPEPEYNPDTWLHDELMKLHKWSEDHRAKQARWVNRMPSRPVGPETPRELVS